LSLQIDCKLEPLPADDGCDVNLCAVERPKTNCTIFLGYTSNIISSGVREVIRYLAQHNMVSYRPSCILHIKAQVDNCQ